MKTNKLVSCPQCSGFGFTSTPVSKNYGITVCRAKTCELCHGSGVIAAPVTNADRIRAMSDVEIADWVSENGAIKTPCDIICGGDCKAIATIEKSSIERCKEIVMKWLQMPAEEDKHEAD